MAEETKKRARLFFQDIELGEVVEEDANFPGLFGKFYPVAATGDSPLRREIQNYIKYSVAADKIMEKSSEKWDAFVEANEMRFRNLIEAEDWYLKCSDQIELIFIPNFCQNNGLVWRWNFFPENEDALSAARLHYANLPLRCYKRPCFNQPFLQRQTP